MKERVCTVSNIKRAKLYRASGTLGLFALLMSFVFLASAQTIVKGRVVGVDGEPMTGANVSLAPSDKAKSLKIVQADKNGKFTITIDSIGIWMLQFAGVGHQDYRIALYVDRSQTIEMAVNLESYRYLQDFSEARVVGDFNRWYVLSGVPLAKRVDGTYEAEIETNGDTVAYRLNGVRDGGPIEGTQADRYVYEDTNGYVSVLGVRPGKVKIVFDPSKFPRSRQKARVTFVRASKTIPRFAAIYNEFQRYQKDYIVAQKDFLRSGKARKDFNFDWSGPLSWFEKQIKHEKIGIMREVLSLCRLSIARTAARIDTSICASCLREISAASRIWSLDPHGMFYALSHSGWTEDRREAYIQRTLKKNPDGRVKAGLLYDLYMVAKLSLQNQKAEEYFHLLVEGYGETPEAALVKQQTH